MSETTPQDSAAMPPASTGSVPHTLAGMYHALVVAHAENARLREAIVRLAEQDATLSVCDRVVTVTMDATLTDAELEAIQQAIYCCEDITYGGAANQEAADVLNALLARLK